MELCRLFLFFAAAYVCPPVLAIEKLPPVMSMVPDAAALDSAQGLEPVAFEPVLVPVKAPLEIVADSFGNPAEETVVEPEDFLVQVMNAIKKLGGVSFLVQVSIVITLLISSLKVTVLREYVWSKLGAAQTWVAPVLGLIAGVLGLGAEGAAITPALVFAYIFAGSGAVALHELLDSLKSMPKLGKNYLAFINLIQKLLIKGKLAKKL